MAIISEIPDDNGSNGDDQIKKPQEDEDKQIETPKQAQNLPISFSILDEAVQKFIGYLHGSHNPTLPPPVVSFFLRLITSSGLYNIASPRLLTSPRLIVSPELLISPELLTSPGLNDRIAKTRSNITEGGSHHGPVLYALVGFPSLYPPKWYILIRKPIKIPNKIPLQLVTLASPPSMPLGSAVVTIGNEMYVFGGCDGYTKSTPCVFLIVSSTYGYRWHLLPNMRKPRYRAAAGVIDGKIYVIGGCDMRSSESD